MDDKEKVVLLAILAKLLLPEMMWEKLGEITDADLRRVDDGQKKINKWLEERANQEAKKCGIKEGDCPYMR
jgi:hypothetical protein